MGVFQSLFQRKPEGPSNDELIFAINAVANEDSPPNRKNLYKELLKSILLIPIPKKTDRSESGKWVVLDDSKDVEIITGQNAKGEKLLFTFTDYTALRVWRKAGASYIALRAQDVFRLAQENGAASIVINPAGPIGGELTSREINFLIEGAIPEMNSIKSGLTKAIFERGTSVMIGAPAKSPSKAFIDLLHDALSIQPDILAGYLYQTKIGHGEPHLVIGIQFHGNVVKEKQEVIFQSIARSIQPVLSTDDFVDFMVLTDPNIISAVKEQVKPIYTSTSSG